MALADQYGLRDKSVLDDQKPSTKKAPAKAAEKVSAPHPSEKPTETEGEVDIIAVVRAEIAKDGSQAAFARRCGVTSQLVNAIFKRNVPVSPRILDAIGYEAVTVTTYRKKS